MANILSINGVEFKSFEEAFTGGLLAPAAGQYYDPAQPPVEGTFQYDRKVLTFPGELAAAGTKINEFKPKMIHVVVLFVGTSKANASALANTTMETFNVTGRYTITLPNGVNRTGCLLVAPGCEEVGWVPWGIGRFCVKVAASFMKLTTD